MTPSEQGSMCYAVVILVIKWKCLISLKIFCSAVLLNKTDGHWTDKICYLEQRIWWPPKRVIQSSGMLIVESHYCGRRTVFVWTLFWNKIARFRRAAAGPQFETVKPYDSCIVVNHFNSRHVHFCCEIRTTFWAARQPQDSCKADFMTISHVYTLGGE